MFSLIFQCQWILIHSIYSTNVEYCWFQGLRTVICFWPPPQVDKLCSLSQDLHSLPGLLMTKGTPAAGLPMAKIHLWPRNKYKLIQESFFCGLISTVACISQLSSKMWTDCSVHYLNCLFSKRGRGKKWVVYLQKAVMPFYVFSSYSNSSLVYCSLHFHTMVTPSV